jgi:hypothetical protein
LIVLPIEPLGVGASSGIPKKIPGTKSEVFVRLKFNCAFFFGFSHWKAQSDVTQT